jgi:hypothetical protein
MAGNVARRDAGRGAEGTLSKLRLPRGDEQALRFFFCDFGQQIGGITHDGTMKKAMVKDADGETMHTGKMRVSSRHGIHDPFERLVEPGTLADIARTAAVFRRLARMIARGHSGYVTVLHRFYGPRPPGELRREVFGELAPLVEYTPTVDRARFELAVKIASDRNAARRERLTADELASERLLQFERATLEHALREVTTGDAVRAGCAVNVVRGEREPKRAYMKRVKLAKTAIAVWATPLIREASELLVQASNAYRATGTA